MLFAKISLVAGLLAKCRYFIGVDNGIKHLAWALNVPHTVFLPHPPGARFILRWMPDFDRSLLLGCTKAELARHVDDARAAIRRRGAHGRS